MYLGQGAMPKQVVELPDEMVQNVCVLTGSILYISFIPILVSYIANKMFGQKTRNSDVDVIDGDECEVYCQMATW